MKKTILLLSFFAVFFGEAQQALLWKITPKEGKSSSYIFGTMHATCSDSVAENVVNALKETKQLCLELDMDNPNLQAEMINEASMKDNAKISSLVDKEDAKILNDYFTKNLGFPLLAIENLKPFFISSMFIQKLLDCEVKSIEALLVKLSLEQEKPIIGLESIKYQMEIFDKIPYEFQAQELLKSIKNDFKEDKLEFDKLSILYKNGDIEGMMQLNESSNNSMTKKYGHIILDERNFTWIKTIKEITSETPTFFGVGALHLPGKNGVLQLLKDNGFKVEVVK
jgi:uncharacterized protein YbaP (TraB family)